MPSYALPRRVLAQCLAAEWLSCTNLGSPSCGRRVPWALLSTSLKQPSSAAQLSQAKSSQAKPT